MRISILHTWLGSYIDEPINESNSPRIIEIAYIIFWNRASLGMTIKKFTLDVKGNQRYDFEYDDEVDRLIEVLDANWEHPCLL